jgi:hypothetical protein
METPVSMETQNGNYVKWNVVKRDPRIEVRTGLEVPAKEPVCGESKKRARRLARQGPSQST